MTTFHKYYYFHSLKRNILEALVYIYYELEHYDILVMPGNSRHLCADNLASQHKLSHSCPVDHCWQQESLIEEISWEFNIKTQMLYFWLQNQGPGVTHGFGLHQQMKHQVLPTDVTQMFSLLANYWQVAEGPETYCTTLNSRWTNHICATTC